MPTSWTTSPRRHLHRYPQEGDFDVRSSPPSSESSSDDEGAREIGTRVHPLERQKTARKLYGRKPNRARNPMPAGAFRDYNTSRYASTSKRSLHRRPPPGERLSPPRAEQTEEVYVTTMDEDDQQMFIALFYWRRKVIESHFSAWKWVACGLRRSAKQIHRQSRPSKPLRSSYALGGLPPPRRNLILKRHTGRSSAEERENRRDYNRSSPEYFKASPATTKARQDGVDELGLNKSSYATAAKEVLVDTQSDERRRQFRTELRSIYSCFSQWKGSVDQSRKKRVHQLVQATGFRRQKQLKTVIRAWKCGRDACKSKRKRLEDADRFHWAAIKQRVFYDWRRSYRVEREIRRRQVTRADQLKVRAFQHWRRCILQTRECDEFTAKRSRRHLRLVFRSLREGVRRAQRERWKHADAVAHYRSKLQLSVLRAWRDAVFEEPLYLSSIHHEKRICLSGGLRRWRRFMTRREERSRQVLLADFFRYRISLRRAVKAWTQYLEWRRHRKQELGDARKYCQLTMKRIGVEAFRSAVTVSRTRRDQVRAATRWHQRKLATKVLKVWVTTTRKRARLRAFQHSVNARILRGVLCGWRKQAARSKHLRSIHIFVSKRWDALLLQACMTRWVRWLHVKSMLSSCELKRRNTTTARHFRAWHGWSRTKVSRRNIVEQQRLRHDAALLQRVVSKWLGVTLRTRCFKRLVKLFRKKRSRHRLQSVFKLWRVHARVCRATRKLDRELTRLSLAEWKRVSRERQEERSGMSVATQYYRERRFVMAIDQWSAFSRRRADSRALSHYFRQISTRALQCWYIAARERRRQSELFRYRQHLREKKAMTRYLHAWYRLVRRRADVRAREWGALQSHLQTLQRRSFYAWFDYLQARRASNERRYVAITAYKNSLQVKVLHAWHLETRQSAQRKLNSSRLRNTLTQRRLQARVRQWSDFCHERRRRRQQVATADRFYSGYLLCLAMFHWQGLWLKTSALRLKEAHAVKQINSRRLSEAVSQWYEHYQQISSSRLMKVKASRFRSKRLLARCLRAWRGHSDAVRHKVSKRRLATRLRQGKVLSRMFQRWQQFAARTAVEKRQLTQALEHRSRVVLRLVFQNWRSYRSKRTLDIIAYTFRRKLLLQKIWLDWKQHRAYVVKARRNILVARQLLRSNLFRSTFLQWKAYVAQHHERQTQLRRADDHHAQYLCKRAVVRLRKQVKFHQAVARAAMFGRINGVRFLWRRWRHLVGTKRKQRHRRVVAIQTQATSHQRRHFSAWKSHTKRCVQGRQNKSDALYRVSCLRMIWSRWCRVVGWRRYITAMGYRRLEYLQAAMLREWYENVRERIDQRAKVARAIEFQEANLREKTWKAWQLYVAYRHEKDQQLVWILSYYSVKVLLRKSLASWKKLLSIQQVNRDNNELADAFNLHRLAHMGIRKWKAFLELRRREFIRQEDQLRKSEMLVLSRTLRKWRKRAVVVGRQHEHELTATEFYSRRRLTRGLDQLLYWRDARKRTRECIVRVKGFRDGKVLAASFKRWRDYHLWRARYAHLTRAFKRNQKEDAFNRWKTFWQQRQSMNEKRLQARVFHCVHLEEKALNAWRMSVRDRKQSKMARAFNSAKVQCKIFTSWKRKVHVLRQMRRMFLYQENFRAHTHFVAWKRYATTRKQLNDRLRGAMKFRDNLVKVDVWHKWKTWVAMQRQERDTILLAVDFRDRFSTRKSFALWKGGCRYWRRKRALTDQAQLHYHRTLLHQCFRALADRRQSTHQLLQLQTRLEARLVQRRKHRVVATLRSLCAESKRKRSLIKRACGHWQLCHQQKYWGRVMRWFDTAKYRKLQRTQADAFARTHLLRRCISALRVHISHTKQLKMKVEAFRCRYFRSVADECFYQWRAFTTFKQKLRVLRRKTGQSQRRQRLHQWRRIAVEQARRRGGMQDIAAKRQRRELVAWFNHWESVCTDRWLNKELVAHHRRHAHRQRLLRSGIAALQAQLPARRQRLKCQTFFLQHHRAFLVQVLQRWRQASQIDHQEGNFNM